MHNEPLTYIYRQGSIQDKQQLKQLGLLAYGNYASVLAPEHWATFSASLNNEERLEELIRKAVIFVCVKDEEIIGMAYLVPHGHPWDVFKAEWAYMRMVGVNPAYNGIGIAKVLTQKCIDHAKNTNESVIALHTSEFMPAARHIYEQLGFKIKEEITPRFGKRYWLYVLELG